MLFFDVVEIVLYQIESRDRAAMKIKLYVAECSVCSHTLFTCLLLLAYLLDVRHRQLLF